MISPSITAVPGIRIGQVQDEQALTGCTVILCEQGAVGGVDQRGGAPGTRETALLSPMHLVQRVHAVLLAGGSAFGLDAAGGVMRYLEERGVGFDTGLLPVPIVPAAILFDLGLGSSTVRPDATMGYQACLNATASPPREGNAGAGTGATVGKILGMERAMKGGLGTAAIDLGGGLVVGAIVAVNAWGDIIDPASGEILAGVRAFPTPGQTPASPFADTLKILRQHRGRRPDGPPAAGSTVIGVVATNAALTKEETNKVAQMAHAGLARAVRPAHTPYDGDIIFALATGEVPADTNLVGAFAAEVFAQAIVRGVLAARPAGGLPSASSLPLRSD